MSCHKSVYENYDNKIIKTNFILTEFCFLNYYMSNYGCESCFINFIFLSKSLLYFEL